MTNYLTIRQACQALQVSRNTLLAMIADGRVQAVDIRRPGGRNAIWRVSASLVKAIIQADELKLRRLEERLEI